MPGFRKNKSRNLEGEISKLKLNYHKRGFIRLLHTVREIENTQDFGQFFTGRRFFYRFFNYQSEYIWDIHPTRALLLNLRSQGIDLFSYVQRAFVNNNAEYPFHKNFENIAVMKIDSFENWWTKTIRKKERQSVKKSEKMGVKIEKVNINTAFLKGVQEIYNETPFREGRRYSGYGLSLAELEKKFEDIGNSVILGAYIDGQLIGILWIAFGDRTAMFRSFVSLIGHRDKCPNNALIAEAVRQCEKEGISYLVYGNHYGFLPSLDLFREHQGFRKCPLPRYFVPLSRAGQLAIKFGLHRRIEYSLPRIVERTFLKLYNPLSKITPASVWWRLGGE